LLALLAACALPMAAPALASAASPGLTVTPSNLQAGGSPTMTFDMQWLASGSSADTPKTVTLGLAPGLLANAAANPSCLLTPNLTAGGPCQIGTATLDASVGTVDQPITGVGVFLAPAQNPATQLATIDLVVPAPVSTTLAAALTMTSTGSLVLTAGNLPAIPTVSLTGLDLTINPTLGGQPFNRLPTSCGAATSTLAVTFAGSTTPFSATGAFTPTGCSTLPFTPTLTATATKDSSDSNVAITTSTTQPNALSQAADKTLTLTVPPAVLSPNVPNALTLLNSGKAVGTATATSPLIPVPLTGTVTLTGTALSSNLTITFAPPFNIMLQGAINLSNSSVTFSDVPDAPLSNLSVTLAGGAQGLYETTCTPPNGTLMGAFTGQNGVSATSNVALTVAGCATSVTPGKPMVFGGSLSGLAKGKGKLKFGLEEGQNAKPIKKFELGLPSGLTFSTNAKADKKGIRVKGATFKVNKHAVTIIFAKPVAKAEVSIGSPAMIVGSKLEGTVRTELGTKKFKPLVFTGTFTDAGNTSTTVSFSDTPKN
jgi:hypothetical protein